MNIKFDAVDLFRDAATEAAKTAASEEIGGLLIQHGFPAVLAEVSKESAKVIVSHMVGPLLGALLKAIDPTQTKLDAILSEPLQTGIRLSKQAMLIDPDSGGDRKLREEMLSSALQNLEKAYSYAMGLKKVNEQAKIRMAQAMIAKSIGANSTALMYADAFLKEVSRQKNELKFLQEEVRGQKDRSLSGLDSDEMDIVKRAKKDHSYRDALAAAENINYFSFMRPNIPENAPALDRLLSFVGRSHTNGPKRGVMVLQVLLFLLKEEFIERELTELSSIERFWII